MRTSKPELKSRIKQLFLEGINVNKVLNLCEEIIDQYESKLRYSKHNFPKKESQSNVSSYFDVDNYSLICPRCRTRLKSNVIICTCKNMNP